MNLSDKRKELIDYLYKHIHEAYKRNENPFRILLEIEKELKQQDKEFIRLIEEINKNEWNPKVAMNNINKLAGDELL